MATAPADFEILRDLVAGRKTGVERKPSLDLIQMIAIGTGQMPLNEYRELKRRIGRFQI